MAAQPTPDPSQQGAAPGGAASAAPSGAPGGAPGGGAPSQSPANGMQMMFAQWYQAAKKLSENPAISSGMQKVMDGLQEAQSAMLTQAPQTPPSQNPPV